MGRSEAMTGGGQRDRRAVVIGTGPAGLTVAYELARFNPRPIVLEKSHTVGGMARTETYKGFHFDLGGHRFFTKVDEVDLFPDNWTYGRAEKRFLRRLFDYM